jgi:uncharacterized glyoxalase superfamily protein PhnB/uncharacterized protein YndB with AHSA1/START domain
METTREDVYEVIESELVISRVFNAPREQVWKAWTDPEFIKSWWGPKGFTSPVCIVNFRLGGDYLFCMRSSEGQNFWSRGTYLEVAKPEKLVMTDSFSDEHGNIVPAADYGMQGDWPLELMVSVTFEDYDGKTRFVLRHHGLPEGEMVNMTETGWNESLDKLDQVLFQFQNENFNSSAGGSETATLTVNPYLNFPGNTEEAFNFYKTVFGGEFQMLTRFRDTPDGANFQPDIQNKIMHIALPIGKGNVLMATDAIESLEHKHTAGNNFYLTLSATSRNEADSLFCKLSLDGKIEMAMNTTFWGSYVGMCKDKFDIQWMISFDETAMLNNS